jgi:hypothetical protein
VRTPLLLVAALFLATRPATADGPPKASFTFTASDIPGLLEGVLVEKAGDYTLKVWSPTNQTWTLRSEGTTLTLDSKTDGPDATPRWTTLGPVSLKEGARVGIVVARAGYEPVTVVGDYTSQTQTRKAAPENRPVPAAISLAVDPVFTADLDLVRGRLDSVDSVADRRRDHVRTNHEGAKFQAPPSAREWEERARDLKTQLRVTLGLFPMPPKTPLNAQVFGKVERDGYTIEKVALETMPGMFLGGNLYRPAGNCRRVPVVLCPHGHWEVGRVHPDVQARCIRLAKLGCIVFLYDMVGYNDSKTIGHKFLNDRLDAFGYSLATLQTWNSIRAVDWLVTLPDVDPARVACTGESGGGTQTFLLSALDPRIAVSAPVVMVSERFQGGCVCENASGLRHGTDNVEIAALAAPRPMKLVGATGDWTSNTLTKVHPAIRNVYERIGTPGDVEAALFDFPHNYNQTSRNSVYSFLGRELLGIDDPASTREGEQTVEKTEDLLAFSKDHPDPGVKTLSEIEGDLVNLRRRQLDKLAPGDDATAWEASRSVLMDAYRVRVGIEPKTPGDIVAREVRKSTRGDLLVTHWVIGNPDRGEQIPVVRLTPAKPSGRVAIVMHDRGKAGLAMPNGDPMPLIRALLDRGIGVIGFDPLLIGESFDLVHPADRRPLTAHYSTYNRSLAADYMNDLATVTAWAGSLGDVREVSLVGLEGAADLALLAKPSLPTIARTYIDLAGFDYGDSDRKVPASLRLPGVAQFGNLKAAAAMAAPMPLWLARPAGSFAKSWPVNAYKIADASSALRIVDEVPKPEDVAKWIDLGE